MLLLVLLQRGDHFFFFFFFLPNDLFNYPLIETLDTALLEKMCIYPTIGHVNKGQAQARVVILPDSTVRPCTVLGACRCLINLEETILTLLMSHFLWL